MHGQMELQAGVQKGMWLCGIMLNWQEVRKSNEEIRCV